MQSCMHVWRHTHRPFVASSLINESMNATSLPPHLLGSINWGGVPLCTAGRIWYSCKPYRGFYFLVIKWDEILEDSWSVVSSCCDILSKWTLCSIKVPVTASILIRGPWFGKRAKNDCIYFQASMSKIHVFGVMPLYYWVVATRLYVQP
jgi:hypothetical protein